jgi:S1-C subfamily serine protease
VTPATLPTEAEALDAYSRVVTHVAELLAPSVANLRVTKRGRTMGAGSGVVITPDGFLLTSAHVVHNGSRVRASFTDGRELSLRTIGADPLSDLAVLRAEDAAETLPVELGTRPRCASGSSSSPSATRTASAAPSPPASSRRSAARCRRAPAARRASSTT